MKIEVGKEYQTRDGRKAIIQEIVEGSEYPNRGAFSGNPRSWARNGEYIEREIHHLDLIAPWENPTITMPEACSFCGSAPDGKCRVKVIRCRRSAELPMNTPQQAADQVASFRELVKADLSEYLSGIQGYAPLEDVLAEAAQQAAFGKGKERHANGKPFKDQPILEITRSVGLGFPTGQVCKKTQEAVGMVSRGEHDKAVEELLGAIVYAAAAIIQIRESAE